MKNSKEKEQSFQPTKETKSRFSKMHILHAGKRTTLFLVDSSGLKKLFNRLKPFF